MAENPSGMGTWGNAGIWFPALSQMIVDTPIEGFDMRSLLQYVKSPYNRWVIPISQGASTATVSRVAEGANIPFNAEPITSQEIVCYKIGEGYPLTREMEMYQQVNVTQWLFKRLAYKMFHTVNVDIMAAITAGVPVASTIAATGTSLGQDGTVFTRAGTFGTYDIEAAKQAIRENYMSVRDNHIVLLVNPEGARMVEELPQYNALNQSGFPGWREGAEVDGLTGNIVGTFLVVSNDVPDGEAYLIATRPYVTRTEQYDPIGFFVESYPLTVMGRDTPQKDGREIYAVHEYGVGIVYGEGTAKITFAGFS